MFQRTPKSSPVAARSPRGEVRDATRLRVAHLLEWRDAAGRVTYAYKAWCAAGRRDRHRLYLLFVAALAREELAALRLQSDKSTVGADSGAG